MACRKSQNGHGSTELVEGPGRIFWRRRLVAAPWEIKNKIHEVLKYIWCGIKCRFKKRTPRGVAPQPKPPCDDRS